MLHPVEEENGGRSQQDLDQSSIAYRIGLHNTDPSFDVVPRCPKSSWADSRRAGVKVHPLAHPLASSVFPRLV